MYRKLILCLCAFLLSAVTVTAQDVSENKQPKTQSEADVNKDLKSESSDVSEDKKAEASEKEDKQSEAKELSGMSIVGNDEAPKSLYIVPWKSSEIGVETSLDMMLTEGDGPVDRDVFKRQLKYYEISTKK